MPYNMTVQGSGLIRTSGLPLGDYTALIRYNFTGLPGAALYRTVMGQLIDAVLAGNIPTTYGGNAAIYSGINDNNYNLDIFFGTTDVLTATTALVAATQYILGYIRKGANHYFYTWGAGSAPVLIGSVTLDLTGANINALVIGNDGGAAGVGDPTNLTVAYFRDWSSAITLNELYNESCSSRAIRTSDLVSDCPFETDLLDKSGHANHFINQSTAGAFTTAVPVATFTIGAFPYSQVVTQAVFNALNLIYLKYTNVATKAIAGYTNKGGTFTPKTQLFLADGVSSVDNFTGDHGFFRILGPGDYYYKITRSAGGASNFDFTTQASSLPVYPDFVVPATALLVNDDTEGFSTIAMNAAGTKLGFIVNGPGGEIGSILGNGVSLWHDRFGYSSKLRMLDKNFNIIAATDTVPSIGSGTNDCCICNSANGKDFYILRVADGKIWKMSGAGTLTDTGKVLPVTNVSAIGINSDATILYYAQGITNNIISKWDMINNISLGALYTIPGLTSGYVARTGVNNNNGEILVLQDGTVVTWYEDFLNANKNTLLHINTDGTLINAVTIALGDYQYIDHINYTQNSSLINIWFFKDTGANIGKFATLALATGILQSSFITDLFSAFENSISSDAVMFGPSASCTMLTYLFLNQGGIYKVVPNKRNDTLWLDVGAATELDVKIPDPLARTALIGG